jgi:hypothetical protein
MTEKIRRIERGNTERTIIRETERRNDKENEWERETGAESRLC